MYVTIGSGKKPLPEEVKGRHAIVNMENDDDQCFKYAVARAIHPVKRDKERVTKILKKQVEELNWEGVKFPTSLKNIDVFENLNKISVMILGWNEEHHHSENLRLPQTKHSRFVQLFLHMQRTLQRNHINE